MNDKLKETYNTILNIYDKGLYTFSESVFIYCKELEKYNIGYETIKEFIHDLDIIYQNKINLYTI